MTKEKFNRLNKYEPIVDLDWKDLGTELYYGNSSFMLNIGDTISLPEFTVPAVTIDGEDKMDFEEHTIKDNAIIYKITDKYIYLVFEHCLFQSAIDLNEQTEWKKTQLRQYLKTSFKKAMNNAGINARKVSLLSLEEVFGDEENGVEPLPYFRYAKHRIATDLEEEESWTYWLKTAASSSRFCISNNLGDSYYNSASNAHYFVRPCFAIKIGE